MKKILKKTGITLLIVVCSPLLIVGIIILAVVLFCLGSSRDKMNDILDRERAYRYSQNPTKQPYKSEER